MSKTTRFFRVDYFQKSPIRPGRWMKLFKVKRSKEKAWKEFRDYRRQFGPSCGRIRLVKVVETLIEEVH